MNILRIAIDISEVAAKLNQTQELIEKKVTKGVEELSIRTHDWIIKKASTTFSDDPFKKEYYLGLGKHGKNSTQQSTSDNRIDQTPKHVRWIKIGDGIWMVELDEKAEWLEDGREPTFMGDWLLKPGAKGVKTAKDGSQYRAIPFKQTEDGKKYEGTKPLFAALVKKQAERQGINLKKIEKNIDGTPKLGTLHKLQMTPTLAQSQAPGLYSKPRGPEEAEATGLKPHGGIYKLQGAVVVQRKTDKGKIKKETVVFRTISSKHRGFRWMYPQVQPANIFKQAHEFALKEWENMVKQIEEEMNQ